MYYLVTTRDDLPGDPTRGDLCAWCCGKACPVGGNQDTTCYPTQHLESESVKKFKTALEDTCDRPTQQKWFCVARIRVMKGGNETKSVQGPFGGTDGLAKAEKALASRRGGLPNVQMICEMTPMAKLYGGLGREKWWSGPRETYARDDSDIEAMKAMCERSENCKNVTGSDV